MQAEVRDLCLEEALALGKQFLASGQHDQAEGLFRAVPRFEPKNFAALNALGAALAGQRKFYEVLYVLGRAVKLDRRHPSGYEAAHAEMSVGIEAAL
jgi:Flp pilus assembly protein TadD